MANGTLFKAVPPLGFSIRLTRAYCELVVTVKHPAMRGREVAMQSMLQRPEEVRRNGVDPRVFLFYRIEEPGRWLCAVVKRLDTDAIKEGERIWSR